METEILKRYSSDNESQDLNFRKRIAELLHKEKEMRGKKISLAFKVMVLANQERMMAQEARLTENKTQTFAMTWGRASLNKKLIVLRKYLEKMKIERANLLTEIMELYATVGKMPHLIIDGVTYSSIIRWADERKKQFLNLTATNPDILDGDEIDIGEKIVAIGGLLLT